MLVGLAVSDGGVHRPAPVAERINADAVQPAMAGGDRRDAGARCRHARRCASLCCARPGEADLALLLSEMAHLPRPSTPTPIWADARGHFRMPSPSQDRRHRWGSSFTVPAHRPLTCRRRSSMGMLGYRPR